MITRRQKVILACALAVVFLVYLPTVTFDFVNRDDWDHLIDNRLISGSPENVWWEYLYTPMIGYPIPVVVLSYKIEHALFGFSPGVYHLTNVIFHTANAFLVFRVGQKLGLRFSGALAALLLFGLHPTTVEGVAWIANRKTLLSMFFGLLAALAFLRAKKPLGKPSFRWVWGLLVLSFFSKVTAVFLVPIFLTWGILLERKKIVRRWKEYAGLIATACVVVLMSIIKVGEVGAYSEKLPFSQWAREIWYAFGYHQGLLAFIHPPSAVHIPPNRPPAFDWSVDLMPLFWLGAAAALMSVAPSKRRLMMFSWLWFFFAMAPGLNLIPLNRYLGDTYVYAPLMGLAWIVGGLIEEVLAPKKPRITKLLTLGSFAVLACWMTVGSLVQSLVWKNGITLWRSVEERYPESAEACKLVGHAYLKWDQPEKGLKQYLSCVRRFPEWNFDKPVGMALMNLGRVEQAELVFRQIVESGRTDPDVEANLKILSRHRKSSTVPAPTAPAPAVPAPTVPAPTAPAPAVPAPTDP